jgi:hypothetical protein
MPAIDQYDIKSVNEDLNASSHNVVSNTPHREGIRTHTLSGDRH